MARGMCALAAVGTLVVVSGCAAGSNSGTGSGRRPSAHVSTVPSSPPGAPATSGAQTPDAARRTAALLVLTVTTYSPAGVTASGRTVTISISPDHACSTGPSLQNRITSQLLQAYPFLRRIEFVVAGTDESLSSYLGDCVSETLTTEIL
jgi:hypothetical protein